MKWMPTNKSGTTRQKVGILTVAAEVLVVVEERTDRSSRHWSTILNLTSQVVIIINTLYIELFDSLTSIIVINNVFPLTSQYYCITLYL